MLFYFTEQDHGGDEMNVTIETHLMKTWKVRALFCLQKERPRLLLLSEIIFSGHLSAAGFGKHMTVLLNM
jgi:hypothetical protein